MILNHWCFLPEKPQRALAPGWAIFGLKMLASMLGANTPDCNGFRSILLVDFILLFLEPQPGTLLWY